jgi:hypothetical protein
VASQESTLIAVQERHGRIMVSLVSRSVLPFNDGAQSSQWNVDIGHYFLLEMFFVVLGRADMSAQYVQSGKPSELSALQPEKHWTRRTVE